MEKEKNYGDKIVFINKDEYDELIEKVRDYDRIKSQCDSLKEERDKLKAELEQYDDKTIHIDFQTFLLGNTGYSYSKSPILNHKLVDSIQYKVSVTNGIVGYERDKIYDKLGELTKEMKREIDEEVDKRYGPLIDDYNKTNQELSDLKENYQFLRDRIDNFNKKHIFHRIK